MEEKSRFQKALDFIRPNRGAEEKAQSNYNQLFGNDASIYGYNTSSGFWESNKLKEKRHRRFLPSYRGIAKYYPVQLRTPPQP